MTFMCYLICHIITSPKGIIHLFASTISGIEATLPVFHKKMLSNPHFFSLLSTIQYLFSMYNFKKGKNRTKCLQAVLCAKEIEQRPLDNSNLC